SSHTDSPRERNPCFPRKGSRPPWHAPSCTWQKYPTGHQGHRLLHDPSTPWHAPPHLRGPAAENELLQLGQPCLDNISELLGHNASSRRCIGGRGLKEPAARKTVVRSSQPHSQDCLALVQPIFTS